MGNLNLVLKFKLVGESELRVKGAHRIKVDGQGGLVFHDAETGVLETINLRDLKAFCIQSVSGSKRPGSGIRSQWAVAENSL